MRELSLESAGSRGVDGSRGWDDEPERVSFAQAYVRKYVSASEVFGELLLAELERLETDEMRRGVPGSEWPCE